MSTDQPTKLRLEKVQRGVAINASMAALRSTTGGESAVNWQTAKALKVVDSQFRRPDCDPGADSQFCDRDLQSSTTRDLVGIGPAFQIGQYGRNRVDTVIPLEI